MTPHPSAPLASTVLPSSANPGADALLPRGSLAFVLVAILAAFMAWIGVNGLLDPLGAAHGFGIDLAAPADAFYLHIKADRDLSIAVLLVGLLVYRRAAPLAVVVAALCIAPFGDCTLSLLDPRGHVGYALAVHGSALLYGIVTTALLVRAHRRGSAVAAAR